MRLDIFIFKTIPSVILRFVAYLIKSNALNDLCSKTFEIHFDSDNQKNAILAPLIDCHDPGRSVSREPNIHSFPYMSLLIRSTVQQKVDKITHFCLCRVHIRGMAVVFLSCCLAFIALHSMERQICYNTAKETL